MSFVISYFINGDLMRYLMTFSYDGTLFNGYQKQGCLRTIEGCLEEALTFINQKHYTNVISSGRTDKKVHALRQKAHFDLNITISDYKLKCALNSNLPEDIHVIEVKKVSDEFHARYMAKKKVYKYYLNMGEYNPQERNYVYQYCKKLDVSSIEEAIKDFIGVHNFKSFTPTKDVRNNYVREIYDAKIEVIDKKIVFTFIGTGFIKYQVRNMVGYLIKIGEGVKDVHSIPDVLKSENRQTASITAHPEGLYLVDVFYE